MCHLNHIWQYSQTTLKLTTPTGKPCRLIDDDKILTRARPGDRWWSDVALHGTKEVHLASICDGGLWPGGLRGQRVPKHIHLVVRMSPGETNGVRSNSEGPNNKTSQANPILNIKTVQDINIYNNSFIVNTNNPQTPYTALVVGHEPP